MFLCVRALLTAVLVANVVLSVSALGNACRDYLRVIEYFPNGTSCTTEHLPTQEDLDTFNITVKSRDFLEEHCCTFGGGDKVFENDPLFEQLYRFTGKPISDFQDQYSSSQRALFWLVEEDAYPNLSEYLRIGQRFALASIYFALSGDTDWIECSRYRNTVCSIPNKAVWMSDQQECDWAFLSCDRNLFVTDFIMPANVLHSVDEEPTITPDIGLLSGSIEKLNLRNNFIGGTIPTSIGSLILLKEIDVSYNRLRGLLPDSLLRNATGLEVVRVGHNFLNGTIPELRLAQLKELRLSFNGFTGDISKVFGDYPKLVNVELLATSFIGVFPPDLCNQTIEDMFTTTRIECPVNCNNVMEGGDASNDCKGFGSGLCSNYIDWVDRLGNSCDVYEEYENPGCPANGHLHHNSDNIAANDACCYCGGGECLGTCHVTIDKQCTNDMEWSVVIDNETISCDWFEDNDSPGCANTYSRFLQMENVSDPRVSCCHCSGYFCEDVSEWRDGRWGKFGADHYDDDDYVFSCLWYQKWDEPGCPLYGDKWPDSEGVTANEACCHCGYDSVSIPPLCHDYNGWIDKLGGGCDVYEFYDDPACPQYGSLFPNDDGISANEACCYCGGGSLKFPSLSPTLSVVPSYKYEPSATPSITPSEIKPCNDYIGWIDSLGFGCNLYELYDDPGCPNQGPLWANDDNVTGSEACCYCGGGFFKFPSSSPTNPTSYSPTISQVPTYKYEPSSTPSLTPTNAPPCYNYIGWVDSYNDGCEWYEAYDQPGCPNQGHIANDDGVSAIDACCYCGGGFVEFPTVSPTTSQVPSYKYEPSSRPSSQCYDYIGWMERGGGTCDLYEDESEKDYYDGPGCPKWGNDATIDGIAANEGCCYCGGGFNYAGYDDFIPHECEGDDDNWRNIVSSKDIPGDYESCSVLDFSFNMSTRSDQAYYDLLNDYCNLLHNGSMFMNEACCICKAISDSLLVETSVEDESCTNSDIQIPKPWPERNCEWFARDENRCNDFGSSTMLIKAENGVDRSANDVCCICGGGTKGCHEFNSDWTDSHPEESFNCNDYDANGRCDADGNGLISFGHSANTQCCVCGGGYTLENDNVVLNASNEVCINEKDWSADGYTCAFFVDDLGAPDVEQCLAFGHITSNRGVNASNGCCDCWYGHDADIGGGYHGSLLGKMLRIGMMSYTDIQYVHNVNGSGHVKDDSTIYEFIRNASESYGFGLIQYDLNELNETRGLGRIPNDPYSACLTGLSLSLLDICIGPYKNSTIAAGSPTSDVFYKEVYILVVRGRKVKWSEYLKLPFSPFHYKAWIVIASVILLLTCLHRWYALGLIRYYRQSEEGDNIVVDSWKRIRYVATKCISVFYYFFANMANGSVETEITDEESTRASDIYIEKLIVVALAVFMFFTLLLYGGSTAAAFVRSTNPHGPEYYTIQDILVKDDKIVCFHDSVKPILERAFPTNTGNFNYSIETDEERLLSLQQGGKYECDGVVISRYSLSNLATQVESKTSELLTSCNGLYPLYEEVLFSQDVIVPISQTLGELGDELMYAMNTMLRKGLYSDVHDWYANLGRECEYPALGEPKGVQWKALVTPLIFSCTLAGTALIIGLTRHCFKSWKRSRTERVKPNVVEDLNLENDDERM